MSKNAELAEETTTQKVTVNGLINMPVVCLFALVLGLYGLSIAPEEMPSWFPWAAGAYVLVVLGCVAKLGGDMFADQMQREYEDKQR